MKGRLGSTLWLLVAFDVAALFAVMLLAFYGGQRAHTAAGITDFSGLNGFVLGAVVVWLTASAVTFLAIANRVIEPVKSLTSFAERFAQGDYRARAAVESSDDFGYIAEHLNRAAEASSRVLFNQETQENLQKSVTEFLTIVS